MDLDGTERSLGLTGWSRVSMTIGNHRRPSSWSLGSTEQSEVSPNTHCLWIWAVSHLFLHFVVFVIWQSEMFGSWILKSLGGTDDNFLAAYPEVNAMRVSNLLEAIQGKYWWCRKSQNGILEQRRYSSLSSPELTTAMQPLYTPPSIWTSASYGHHYHFNSFYGSSNTYKEELGMAYSCT